MLSRCGQAFPKSAWTCRYCGFSADPEKLEELARLDWLLSVSGEARVTLKDGLPVGEILDLSLPLPGSLQDAIEQEIQVQLQRAEFLPVRFTSAGWGDGVVIVKGVIR